MIRDHSVVSTITSCYEQFSPEFYWTGRAEVIKKPALAGRTAMFEQEIELEKRESSVVPLLLIAEARAADNQESAVLARS